MNWTESLGISNDINAVKPQRAFHIFPMIICGFAALFYVYDYFIQVSPSIMTHQLMRAFNIGAGELGVLSAAFYYSYTLMQIPAGLLLDRLGARILLTFAVLISAAGVTLFSQTHSLFFAGVARFCIGLGSSFAFISSLYLVANWFSHKHFAMIAGLIQFGAAMGSVVGLAPLAFLINSYGWRETLLVTGLVTFGLALLFWSVIRNGNQSPVAAYIDVDNEWKRLRFLVTRPQVWWTAACGLVSWVPVAVIGALWGVPYLMRVYDMTNTGAGRLCSLFWLGIGLGSPFMGWYSSWRQRRREPLLICFSASLVASILIYFASTLPVALVAVAIFLLGFGASVQSMSFGVIKDIVPPQLFATASGFNNMGAILGGAIAQPLVGFLLHLQWSGVLQNGIPIYSVTDYRFAFLVLPLVAVLGLCIVRFCLQETHCRPHYYSA